MKDDIIKIRFYSMAMKWSPNKRIVAGFGSAFVILIIIGVVSYKSQLKYIETSNLIIKIQTILKKLDNVYSMITDAETGERGYIITGNELYLKPFNAALANINQEIKELRELIKDNPIQMQRLDALEPLLAEKLEGLKERIDLQKNKGFEAAAQEVRSGRGMLAMEKILKIITEMKDYDENLLKKMTVEAEASANRTIFIIIFGSSLAFLIVGIASFISYRKALDLKYSEEELKKHHERLEQLVGERTTELKKANEQLEIEIKEHKQMKEKIKRQADELANINAIVTAVSWSLDLDEVLRLALEKVLDLFELEAGGIYLFDEFKEEIILKVHKNLPLHFVEKVARMKIGVAGFIDSPLITGQILVMDDLSRHPAVAKIVGEDWHNPLAVVPLKAKNKVLGNMNLLSHLGKPFASTDIELLMAIGHQIGIAIENASLYNQAQREITERKQIEEKLKTASNEWRTTFDSATDLIILLDSEMRIIKANLATTRFLQKPINEILGKTCFREFHGTDKPCERCPLEKMKNTKKNEEAEFYLSERNIWIKMSADPILDDRGNIIGFIDIIRDITQRKQAEKQVKVSLKEKEVLLKEIHHRVKNNLQVIFSLLNLQSRHIKDEKMIEMFRESQNRIKSMTFIHEKLYQSKDLSRIDFAEYINALTTDLFRSYGVSSKAITLKINVRGVLLGIDTAIPCGLIINELVSNSLKHAFPADNACGEGSESKGEIRIDLHSRDNMYILGVGDNGVGLPKDFDFKNVASLGLRLVSILTDQMGGAAELDRTGGTTFRIIFTEQKYG